MTGIHLVLRDTHISMGMLALLSGAAAMTLRKGARWHRWTGNVFVGSMLVMAASGTTIALFITPVAGNVMGGLLAFYLAATGWAAAWRRPRQTGTLEIALAVLGLLTAITGFAWGYQAAHAPTHRLDGSAPAFYMVFGSVALLATALDVRMLARGGFAGAQRTARHLSRMGLAMFMATSSFFLGQAKLFSPAVRASGVLKIPVFLVVGAVLYWLVRVRVWPWLRRARAARLATNYR
jgi:uncharacterized membrane protein